jgi:hypothetical protein
MIGASGMLSCDHPELVEWAVSMTAPSGETGITIEKCTACLISLLHTPAVQVLERTVHVKRLESS